MGHLEKMPDLVMIMTKVHALVDYAWPRDDCGVSPMTDEAERLIMDIQVQAAKALGLPTNTKLLTGNLATDL